VRRLLLLAALAVVALGAAASSAQAASTIVTLGFDDALATQAANRALLSSRGLRGVFYINTGKLGSPGYMTWDQVAQVAADGNEIGGHTVDHPSLAGLPATKQRSEICDDRAALVAHGYAPVSFAYPYGADDASAQQIAKSCGYTSARTTRGIDWPSCDVCAELIPPRNAFSSRALQMNSTVSTADMELAVTNAEQTGGGWLQLVMHDVCDGCDPYGVPAPKLAAFFDWLKARASLGTVVMTPAQVMGGAVPPPPPPPPPPADTTPPTVALTAPANGSALSGPTTLTAAASDDVGVARVEFLVNGAVIATDPSAPYTAPFDPASVSGTSATLAARATDAAGNVTTSPSRTVTIVRAPAPDTTKPTVAITAPLNGASITGAITVRVNATDNVGVVRVGFLVDGSARATDTTAPYSASGTLERGTHTIVAEAVDAAGNTQRSTAIRVAIR
jgi:peptidoglycan/xylan/chitin deacetylase (PgdA/CDA1 family)